MIGEPGRGCGLAVRNREVWDSLTISPGEGTAGSLSCKFMRTVERLLPAWEDCRFLVMELLDDPAKTVLADA